MPLIIFITIILLFSVIELIHFLSSTYSPLLLIPKSYNIKDTNSNTNIFTSVEIINPHKRMEVMIPDFTVQVTPFGSRRQAKGRIQTRVKTNHPDQKNRNDDYWSAYILKSKKATRIDIEIDISKYNTYDNTNIESIWVEVKWINYGPFGRIKRKNGFVIPLNTDKLTTKNEIKQIKGNVIPIRTHILGVLDDPLEIIRKYTKDIIENDDILTIGETPLAIMQGRYINPSELKISLIAKLLCRFFHPTSSLATACGIQSLINIVGPSRVLISFIIGVFSKLIGIKGVFYRLAGEQARLIDDITGTTPPYDKSIVLGPERSQSFCEQVSKELKIKIAIVDVNDLGKVKVLSKSKGCDANLIIKALRDNPAGNADQQTPIVLIKNKTSQRFGTNITM